MVPDDFNMRTAMAAAERLKQTYRGRLVVNPSTVRNAVEGVGSTKSLYAAPEIIEGDIIPAVYGAVIGDPANSGLIAEISQSVERAHDIAQKRSRIAAKDFGVKSRRPATQIMYESPGGNGMAYDFSLDRIFVPVPMALAEEPKIVESFVEEDTHAYTKDRAPSLFESLGLNQRTNQPKDIAVLFPLFVIEGIGQLYAHADDYPDNKRAVRKVGEGNVDFIRQAQSSPYVGGFLVMDTMKRAHGRRKAVNRAIDIDSPEEFLREYGLACKRLKEPAINLWDGLGETLYQETARRKAEQIRQLLEVGEKSRIERFLAVNDLLGKIRQGLNNPGELPQSERREALATLNGIGSVEGVLYHVFDDAVLHNATFSQKLWSRACGFLLDKYEGLKEQTNPLPTPRQPVLVLQ
ncbi:MAG: hypothetical protein HY362_02250 [Candidatus Aenigmarchaeota archaeon]|nr:hypothetical protein [Candidatus Aenigmarchaeota archaeon]